MASAGRPHLRRRIRLAIGGAVVLTALTVGTASASAPSQPDTRPRTAIPGFLLDRGRSIAFDAPGARMQTGPTQPETINNRGQVVGFSFDGANLTSVRSFLLAKSVKGPFTPVAFPGAPLTLAAALNDHGQLVGSYQNPDRPAT